MLLDFIYRTSRRCIPASLYVALRNSPIGRGKNYDRLPTYRAGVKYFVDCGLKPDGLTILEIGCGNQFFSALEMIARGSRAVISCDPALDKTRLPEQLICFNTATGLALELENVQTRIHAFSDISKIPPKWNSSVNAIVSHYVLEHIQDLDAVFAQSWRLMSKGSLAIHRVDLGDHIYQLFGHFPILRNRVKFYAQNHMRWSPFLFALMNDPKCYMARHIMPGIVALAKKTGFSCETVNVRHNNIPPKIHASILNKCPVENRSDLDVVQFTLVLTKAA